MCESENPNDLIIKNPLNKIDHVYTDVNHRPRAGDGQIVAPTPRYAHRCVALNGNFPYHTDPTFPDRPCCSLKNQLKTQL
jgi:hypothetical protein